MNKAEQLLTLGAIRSIELQRLATWMLINLIADLEAMERRVVAVALGVSGEEARTHSERLRIERQVGSDIEQAIKEAREIIRKRMVETFDQLIPITTQEEKNNFLLVYGFSLVGTAGASGRNILIVGSTIDDHLKQLERDLHFRIMAQVRDSIAAGEAEELMYHRLKGSKRIEQTAGEFAQTRNRLEAVVRTGVSTVPNAVQLELKPRPQEIAKHGWQHISVLDSRTSSTCRERAFRRWDDAYKPIGHSLPFRQPPLHANCRSRIQMIFVDDPEPQALNFKQWIEQLSKEQKAKLFGAANLQRWERGGISDAELIRQQNRPMSIEQLRKRTETKQGEFPYL